MVQPSMDAMEITEPVADQQRPHTHSSGSYVLLTLGLVAACAGVALCATFGGNPATAATEAVAALQLTVGGRKRQRGGEAAAGPVTRSQTRKRAAAAAADGSELAPLLGDGTEADWFFVFKLPTAGFQGCSGTPSCIFGGDVQQYRTAFGLQYLEAHSVGGSTSALQQFSNCLGSSDDPVSKTFKQVYDGTAANYIIWNDQLYGDPQPNLSPKCYATECGAPWGHSKGFVAWGEDGTGFIMQVSTPDWPGNGDSAKSRSQGNTLGCVLDDDVKVAQHFFALRLSTVDDTRNVLKALQVASVVTDPSQSQLVKLTKGPTDLATLANSLGQLSSTTQPLDATLSSGVRLIAKPNALAVPPWHMVSALASIGLRTATWWASPKINSMKAGTPGCWDSSLPAAGEVQVALTGSWSGSPLGFRGISSTSGNHAKIAHSLTGSTSVFGDMNMQGMYSPSDGSCSASQNGRGGLFFLLEDATMHDGIQSLLAGTTSSYGSGKAVEDLVAA